MVSALLWLVLRGRYVARYRALVDYFADQRAAEIVSGGLLAGGGFAHRAGAGTGCGG